MDFLGFYNLFMALAVAGACGVCDGSGSESASNYGPDSAYVAQGGGDSLPPAYAIINRPPTQVDNGYNPAFYWNQPQEAADDYDNGDNGYRGGYGYQANYPQPVYDAAAADLAYADAVNGGDNAGYYGGYDGGYYAYGGDEDGAGYYQRPVYLPHREHHERRDTMQRHDRDPARDMGNRDAHADERHAAARAEQDDRAHAARDNRGSGYNGHDGHMFDGDHRPATPAAAGYQIHDRKGDGHDHPRQ
jgi:hypothetical protein